MEGRQISASLIDVLMGYKALSRLVMDYGCMAGLPLSES